MVLFPLTCGLFTNVLFTFRNWRYFSRCLSVVDFPRNSFVVGKYILCDFNPLKWIEPSFSGPTHIPCGMFHEHLEGICSLPCCVQRPRRAGRGEGLRRGADPSCPAGVLSTCSGLQPQRQCCLHRLPPPRALAPCVSRCSHQERRARAAMCPRPTDFYTIAMHPDVR